MLREAFATRDDLIRFRGSETLPDNASILLDRASEIIWSMVRCSYKPQNDAHVSAVRMATCAQVSYWINTGTSPDDDSGVESFSIGDISMSGLSSAGGKKSEALCPLSLRYLRNECLLYRGIVRG